jgi:hypothetical protein
MDYNNQQELVRALEVAADLIKLKRKVSQYIHLNLPYLT